jgi:hypothetical protein
MHNKGFPMVWVAQGDDSKWKWCVGTQQGGDPIYISTASFKSAKYAKQNAEITLQRRGIKYIMAPKNGEE